MINMNTREQNDQNWDTLAWSIKEVEPPLNNLSEWNCPAQCGIYYTNQSFTIFEDHNFKEISIIGFTDNRDRIFAQPSQSSSHTVEQNDYDSPTLIQLSRLASLRRIIGQVHNGDIFTLANNLISCISVGFTCVPERMVDGGSDIFRNITQLHRRYGAIHAFTNQSTKDEQWYIKGIHNFLDGSPSTAFDMTIAPHEWEHLIPCQYSLQGHLHISQLILTPHGLARIESIHAGTSTLSYLVLITEQYVEITMSSLLSFYNRLAAVYHPVVKALKIYNDGDFVCWVDGQITHHGQVTQIDFPTIRVHDQEQGDLDINITDFDVTPDPLRNTNSLALLANSIRFLGPDSSAVFRSNNEPYAAVIKRVDDGVADVTYTVQGKKRSAKVDIDILFEDTKEYLRLMNYVVPDFVTRTPLPNCATHPLAYQLHKTITLPWKNGDIGPIHLFWGSPESSANSSMDHVTLKLEAPYYPEISLCHTTPLNFVSSSIYTEDVVQNHLGIYVMDIHRETPREAVISSVWTDEDVFFSCRRRYLHFGDAVRPINGFWNNQLPFLYQGVNSGRAILSCSTKRILMRVPIDRFVCRRGNEYHKVAVISGKMAYYISKEGELTSPPVESPEQIAARHKRQREGEKNIVDPYTQWTEDWEQDKSPVAIPPIRYQSVHPHPEDYVKLNYDEIRKLSLHFGIFITDTTCLYMRNDSPIRATISEVKSASNEIKLTWDVTISDIVRQNVILTSYHDILKSARDYLTSIGMDIPDTKPIILDKNRDLVQYFLPEDSHAVQSNMRTKNTLKYGFITGTHTSQDGNIRFAIAQNCPWRHDSPLHIVGRDNIATFTNTDYTQKFLYLYEWNYFTNKPADTSLFTEKFQAPFSDSDIFAPSTILIAGSVVSMTGFPEDRGDLIVESYDKDSNTVRITCIMHEISFRRSLDEIENVSFLEPGDTVGYTIDNDLRHGLYMGPVAYHKTNPMVKFIWNVLNRELIVPLQNLQPLR